MKNKRRAGTVLLLIAALIIFVLTLVIRPSPGGEESLSELMKDAVLHEKNRISLFGIKDVNPGLISAYCVTGIFLVIGLLVRFIEVPRFKMNPGKVQLLLEMAVGYFDSLAKKNSPHRNGFLGVYLFSAGSYIFVGTLFELLGWQAVTTEGASISLPAPLSDINGDIAMGVTSFLVIVCGGFAANRMRGAGSALKEFSLPISMSFRLFGALLSGALVTEMVYYTAKLSYFIPVAVGVLFTILHAIVQTYVLTMLVSLFYGEVTEPPKEKPKKQKKQKENQPIIGGQLS